MSRLASSVSQISDEMTSLAECHECDSDEKMQQYHEFSRARFGDLVRAAQALEAQWADFEQGYNARALRLQLAAASDADLEQAELESDVDADAQALEDSL